jgi:hypothetical protein
MKHDRFASPDCKLVFQKCLTISFESLYQTIQRDMMASQKVLNTTASPDSKMLDGYSRIDSSYVSVASPSTIDPMALPFAKILALIHRQIHAILDPSQPYYLQVGQYILCYNDNDDLS